MTNYKSILDIKPENFIDAIYYWGAGATLIECIEDAEMIFNQLDEIADDRGLSVEQLTPADGYDYEVACERLDLEPGQARKVYIMGAWNEERLGVVFAADIIDDRDRIGKRIIELRQAHGLTQQQLADLVGMKRSNLSRLECGAYGATFDTLTRIAGALGCQIDFVALN